VAVSQAAIRTTVGNTDRRKSSRSYSRNTWR
jgi:hypothetical protein